MHILVTGAAGFIGSHLLAAIKARGHQVTAVCRTRTADIRHADTIENIDIAPDTRWGSVLADVDGVIHLADGLRAFEGLRTSPGKLEENNAIEMTLNLARAASVANVQNFVYLSSIKAAAGEYSDSILVENDQPSKTRPLYGRLKLQIEIELFKIALASSMKVITLRSPIVYGAGGGGNFAKLIRLADTPWPLPLAGINNKRSIIAVSNLCDVLVMAAQNSPARSGAYFIHDGEALSVPELFASLRHHLGRPARLYSLPKTLISLAEMLPGTRPVISRLTRSLELSDDKFRRDFIWSPPLATDAALKQTVDAYKNSL